MSKNTVVIGTQWGDEGKGKVVDYLTESHDVIVRFQGGDNAGHTIIIGENRFPLHLIPAGILYAQKTCVIADGTVVNPQSLAEELTAIREQATNTAKLYLSKRTHVVMPWHLVRDGITGKKIGTTQKGIGPTYTDAVGRKGIRVMDFASSKIVKELIKKSADVNRQMIEFQLKSHGIKPDSTQKQAIKKATDAEQVFSDYSKYFKTLKKLGVEIIDSSEFLNSCLTKNKSILFEGAQATLLDITYGDYPYVTSSHPTVGGVLIGAGCRPRDLKVIGISKAYTTRVSEGPHPTELVGKVGKKLREEGREYDTTTKEPLRCGWLDLVALKYAIQVNGVDTIALTKLDVLSKFKTIKVAVAYRLGGEELKTYPPETWLREKVKPIYQEFRGWQVDISQVRKFADLPKEAKTYVKFIEKYLKTPVGFIGVGPGRKELIDCQS